MTSPDFMELVAYTTPDVHTFESQSCRYDRVVGLRNGAGESWGEVEAEPRQRIDKRHLEVSPVIGERIVSAFQLITEQNAPTNCHGFARMMVGLPPEYMYPPDVDFAELPKVEELAPGSVGVIGIEGHGVVHSVGYGLGRESLQNLSCFGEFGFVPNDELLEYYKGLSPDPNVGLYQLPVGDEPSLLAL